MFHVNVASGHQCHFTIFLKIGNTTSKNILVRVHQVSARLHHSPRLSTPPYKAVNPVTRMLVYKTQGRCVLNRSSNEENVCRVDSRLLLEHVDRSSDVPFFSLSRVAERASVVKKLNQRTIYCVEERKVKIKEESYTELGDRKTKWVTDSDPLHYFENELIPHIKMYVRCIRFINERIIFGNL